MGLQIKRWPAALVRRSTIFVAVLALVAQPVYGLVSAQVARAVAEDSVVINEISPKKGNGEKWIELYNKSDSAVDISGWRFVRNTSTVVSPVLGDDVRIEPKSFYVYTTGKSLTPDASLLKVVDGPDGSVIDSVNYPTLENNSVYARTADGSGNFEVRAADSATRGASNVQKPELPPKPTVTVTAPTCENPFNVATFDMAEDTRIVFKDGENELRIRAEDVTQPINVEAAAQEYNFDPSVAYGTELTGEAVFYDRANQKKDISLGNVTIKLTDPASLECAPEDETPPQITFNSFSEGDRLNGTHPFKLSISDDSLMRYSYRIVRMTDDKVYPVNEVKTSSENLDNKTVYEWDTSEFGDGTYRIYASAVDEAENRIEKSIIVYVDNTKPEITVKPDFVGSESAKVFSNVSFRLNDNDVLAKYRVNDWEHDVPATAQRYANFDLIKTHLKEGENTFTAYDRTGNEAEYRFVYDPKASSAPRITSPTPRQYFKGDSIVNSWTIPEDENGIRGYQVRYEFENGTTAYRNTSKNSRTQTFTGSYQGPITLSVRAQDNAGNWSEYGAPVTYNYDSIDPHTTLEAPTGMAGNEFTVKGTASDNLALNRVYVQLVNRDDGSRYGGATIHLIGKGKNADWSKTYNAEEMNLPEGRYAAHVKVVDRAGNADTTGWTENFTLDKTSPKISIKDGYQGDKASKVFSEVSFKLSDETNVDRLTLNGVEKDLTDNKWSDLNAVTSGTFGGREGGNTLIVYDVVGNKTTYTFTIQTIAPIVTLDEYKSGEHELKGTINSKDASFRIVNNGKPVEADVKIDADANKNGMYTWTFTIPQSISGEGELGVSASFNGGVYSEPKTATYAFEGNENNADNATNEKRDQEQPTAVTVVSGDSEGTDERDLTALTRALSQPFALPSNQNSNLVAASIFDGTTDLPQNDGSEDVLGAQSGANEGDTSSAATPITNVAATPSSSGWQIFGIAWYWWLTVVALLGAALWWALARNRGTNEQYL